MADRGRPALYKPENAGLARKFCMLGATNDDLAGLFEVAPRTVDNWIATIPEFTEEVRRGREIADVAVVQSLHSRAIGYSYKTEKLFHYHGAVVRAEHTVHHPPETRACIFWLRNRQPQRWREKAEPEPAPAEGLNVGELEAAAERAAGGAQLQWRDHP